MGTSDLMAVFKIARAFRQVQFENWQNHEYLLFTNCTRRSCDFLFIVHSTILWTVREWCNFSIYKTAESSKSYKNCGNSQVRFCVTLKIISSCFHAWLNMTKFLNNAIKIATEYNLGLIVLLLTNENWVILLSVL